MEPEIIAAIIGAITTIVATYIGIAYSKKNRHSPAAFVPPTTEVDENRETIAELIETLQDPHEEVRIGAVRILGDMKTKKALPHLIRLLKDPKESIRKEVQLAIDKINGKIVPPSPPERQKPLQYSAPTPPPIPSPTPNLAPIPNPAFHAHSPISTYKPFLVLGINGRIEVLEDRVRILRTGLWRFWYSLFGIPHLKDILFQDLTSVQLVRAGFFSNGNIKFLQNSKTEGFILNSNKVIYSKFFQKKFDSLSLITQNLSRLSHSYQQGQLSEEEFLARKAQYLQDFQQEAAPKGIAALFEWFWRLF